MINTLPCCTLLVLRLYCEGVKFLGLSLPNLKPRPNENCHSFSTTNSGENRKTIWELPQSRLISRLHAALFKAWGSLKMLDKQPSWHSNCYGETSWNMTITHGSLFFPNIFRQTQIKPTSSKKTESGCHVNTEDFFKNQSLSPCRTWQHLAHHPSPIYMSRHQEHCQDANGTHWQDRRLKCTHPSKQKKYLRFMWDVQGI